MVNPQPIVAQNATVNLSVILFLFFIKETVYHSKKWDYTLPIMKVDIVSTDPIFAQTMKERLFRVSPDIQVSLHRDPFGLIRKRKRACALFFLLSQTDFLGNGKLPAKLKAVKRSRNPVIIYSDHLSREEQEVIPSEITSRPASLSMMELKDLIETLAPSMRQQNFAHYLPAAAYRCALDSALSISYMDESLRMLTDCFHRKLPSSLVEMAADEDRETLLRSRLDQPDPGTKYAVNFRINCGEEQHKLVQDRGIIQSDPKSGMLYCEGLLIDLEKIMRAGLSGEQKPANVGSADDSQHGVGYFEYDPADKQFHFDAISSDLLRVHSELKPFQLLRETRNRLKRYDLKALPARFNEFIRGNSVRFNIHFQYLHDDQWKYIAMQCHKLQQNNKYQKVKYVGILQDVTREKEELDRAKLADRQEAVGALAGGLAHDFNNRLQVIMGYTAMIQHKFKNKELEQDLWNIENAVIEASDISSKLLAYSKRGKYLDIRSDLHKLIEKAVQETQTLFPWVQQHILIDLSAEESLIKGDPRQITDAVISLLKNSIESGGEEELVIEIRTTNRISAGDSNQPRAKWLDLTIRDNGTGLNEELRHRVFEPYFTTKNPAIHSGLGLPAVIGTVEVHNGHFKISNAPDGGMEAVLSLPTFSNSQNGVEKSGKQPPATELQSEAIEMPAESREEETAGRRILIIDDDHAVNQITAALLESMGYSVRRAYSGPEAIELYQNEYPEIDLILLDMILPGMDGKEIFSELKKINPSVKALIISGYSRDSKAQETLKMGAVGFVQKPLRKKDLKEAVEHHV